MFPRSFSKSSCYFSEKRTSLLKIQYVYVKRRTAMQMKQILILFLAVFFSFISTACVGVGETEVETSTIELGDVESATIYLPEDIGVRVHVNGGIGSVDAHGFYKKNATYMNDAFGKTDLAITIQIDAGIGSIELKTRKSSFV
jgi:hypothetical protein